MVMVALIDALFPMMNRAAIDRFIVPGTTEGLGRFLALYGVMVAVQAANVFALITLAGRVEVGIVHDLRKTGFRRLQELSFSYYDRTPVGWIMARMTSDAQRLGDTISWGLVDIAWGHDDDRDRRVHAEHGRHARSGCSLGHPATRAREYVLP